MTLYYKFNNIGGTNGYIKHTLGTIDGIPNNPILTTKLNGSADLYIGAIQIQKNLGSARYIYPTLSGQTVSLIEMGYTYGGDLEVLPINVEVGVLQRR